MHYLLDEDLSTRVAVIARRAGLDVVTIADFGRNSLPDEAQLLFATSIGCCIVTRNRDDFMRLGRVFALEGRLHAGKLLVPRSIENDDFAGLARAIVAYEQEHPEGLAPGMVDYLRHVP